MKRLIALLTVIIVATPVSAQEFAKQLLSKSRRHHELVKVMNGKREVQCFVVFPEMKNRATAVLVIIAPDMLSALAPRAAIQMPFPI